MRTWGGDQVEAAVASGVGLLRTVTDRDWEGVPAGRLEWSCLQTAEHLAGTLLAYASLLASRSADAYVPFDLTLDEGTGPAGVADVVETTGTLLAMAVRTTPRAVRAYHPYPFRGANREGFAAMAVTELLLHTHDIAEGLGVPYEPPADLCAGALTRLFPHVRPDAAPWPTLRWATGRGELPDRAPVTGWHWVNPLALPAERLTLEALTPAAAVDLHTGGDGGYAWLGGTPLQGARDASGMLVKAYENGVLHPEFGVFVVVRREDDRALGTMGFHGPPDDEGRVEVGYDLVEPARGHGYATEALRALTAHALAHDEVRTLCAVIDEDNLPSQGVATRAGFVPAPLEADRTAEERQREQQEQGERTAAPQPLRLYVRER
ncbi:GNAT family N-acetyltransferase [Streptomyces longwoodensis]|uniref:GNAT family N-acetyltransferase n=1 Tax=Streptomyces longwoodensis TaxID=68231 RepID=UPI0032555D30